MQSVQRSLSLLFQGTLFLRFLLFQKYLSPQVRNNKMENSVVYHPCPSRLASRIHLFVFFKLLKVLSLSRILIEFIYSTMCGKKFSIYGVHIPRKCIESMHFHSCPSSSLKSPGRIF